MTRHEPVRAARRPIRWWPALAVLALSAAAHLWIWMGPEPTRQYRMIRTFIGLFATVLLLLLWFLFFSRLRLRTRLIGLVLIALLGIGAAQTLEIRGVTGDLRPIVAWKWAARGASLDGVVGPESAAASVEASSRDFPQFLGPRRDAVLDGIRLERDWLVSPPREVWRRQVGAGWASFAVVGGLAVTQEQRGDEELVTAYELESGEPLWTHADRARYATTIGGVGPRATPAIDSGRVHTLGATGILNTLDLATGAKLWSRDVVAENGAVIPEWGKSSSPLVVDGLVIVSAGGSGGRSLVAYDAETGGRVWSGGNGGSSYASPTVATVAGVRQVLIVNTATVAAHDPATGKVLWEHPWSAVQPNVAQPLVLPGDRLLISKGYGYGSELWQLSAAADGGFRVEVVWKSPRLKLKFTNAVLYEDSIYGLDDGVLVCLDPATGERRWKHGRYGHGQLLLVEGLLLIQAENGDVVLVQPHPEELRELGRFTAFDRKTWNIPTLAGSYLLVRNDREAAMYELPAQADITEPGRRRSPPAAGRRASGSA